MARIRTVKPQFFRHYEMFRAEADEGLPLRLAFIGLWCVADREGRFKWVPEELKIECLPYDNVDFSRVLDALSTRGFIVKYRVGTRVFGWIPTFTKHQIVNNRESKSELPSFEDGEEIIQEINDLTREARDDDASVTREARRESGKEGKGREGKGREGEEPPPAAAVGAAAASANGKYEWEGEIIKLTPKDFRQWEKSFPYIDLPGQLASTDAWLASSDATNDQRRKWFHVTAAILRKRNDEAKAKAQAQGPPKPRRPNIMDPNFDPYDYGYGGLPE